MSGLEHVVDYTYPANFDSLERVEGWARDIWKELSEAQHGLAEDLELVLSQKWSFKTIAGITNDVVADQQEDTLTLAGDAMITITGTAATDTITWTWAHLGIESLTDPGADRIAFWDETVNSFAWLAPDDVTIEISGTTLQVISAGVDHGSLIGLADDDHPQYIKDSEFTQADGVLVGSGAGTFTEKLIGTDIQAWDSFLDDIAALIDPGKDILMGWDESSNQIEWIEIGATLTTTAAETPVLGLNHLGIEDLAGSGSDAIMFFDFSASKSDWLVPSTGIQISTTNLTTKDSEIDHDSLQNFVGNKHIDYTSAIDNTNYVTKQVIRASVYLSATQVNLTDTMWTQVTFDTENYDGGADFNTGTHLFIVPVTGYYSITATIIFTNVIADKVYDTRINKNSGTIIAMSNTANGAITTQCSSTVTGIFYLTATDTIGVDAQARCGANTVDVLGGAIGYSQLAIHLLSV